MGPVDPSAGPGAYAEGRETGTAVNVHAGFPNPAAERAGTPLSLDRLLVRHPSSTFFFRIRGHNWHHYGVLDGDLAVVDRAITPRAQDLVVWWQDSGDLVVSTFGRVGRATIWGTITALVHPLTSQE